MNQETKIKLSRIEKFTEKHNLDGLLLADRANISWLTAGKDTHIELIEKTGSAKLVILPGEGNFIFTDNIEEPRLKTEELFGQNFEFITRKWYQDSTELNAFISDYRLGADLYHSGTQYLPDEIASLRFQLTETEKTRLRELGRESSKIITGLCQEKIAKNQTENQVAGLVAGEVLSAGIKPAVILIGSDERIYNYRHPIPTDKKINKYVMVVVCAEKHGFIVSLTRKVHFGSLPGELQEKMEAVRKIELAFWEKTRPGNKIKEVFNNGREAYAELGYEKEWENHHQGGPAGYKTRDFLATPETTAEVKNNQVFAWNPSLTGVKSEDTILVADDGIEIITEDPKWPLTSVEYSNLSFPRPEILIK